MLSLVPPLTDEALNVPSSARSGDQGLVDVLSLQRRYAGGASLEDEQAFFMDTLVEYQWARDVAGLASSTLDGLTKPVIEVCDHYQLVPWQLTPRHVDAYFAGPGKRQAPTIRSKLNKIDHFFPFLEQRYAHEIFRQFGAMVESPIDLSTGRHIAGTSGCGSHRLHGRQRSSSRPGGRICRTPARRRWAAATT